MFYYSYYCCCTVIVVIFVMVLSVGLHVWLASAVGVDIQRAELQVVPQESALLRLAERQAGREEQVAAAHQRAAQAELRVQDLEQDVTLLQQQVAALKEVSYPPPPLPCCLIAAPLLYPQLASLCCPCFGSGDVTSLAWPCMFPTDRPAVTAFWGKDSMP